MKKIVALIFVMVVASISPVVYAADNNGGNLSFWEMLRKRIESFTPQKKISSTNAVGGVRGALADASDIYWKGEVTQELIDADEMVAFKKAMDTGVTGDKIQAQAAFSDFIKNYPDSSLRKDADQALATLSK
jgi:TolA-binding protein